MKIFVIPGACVRRSVVAAGAGSALAVPGASASAASSIKAPVNRIPTAAAPFSLSPKRSLPPMPSNQNLLFAVQSQVFAPLPTISVSGVEMRRESALNRLYNINPHLSNWDNLKHNIQRMRVTQYRSAMQLIERHKHKKWAQYVKHTYTHAVQRVDSLEDVTLTLDSHFTQLATMAQEHIIASSKLERIKSTPATRHLDTRELQRIIDRPIDRCITVYHSQWTSPEQAESSMKTAIDSKYDEHRLWSRLNIAMLPVTWLIGILPGPNVFLWFNLWRLMSHQRAARGIDKLRQFWKVEANRKQFVKYKQIELLHLEADVTDIEVSKQMQNETQISKHSDTDADADEQRQPTSTPSDDEIIKDKEQSVRDWIDMQPVSNEPLPNDAITHNLRIISQESRHSIQDVIRHMQRYRSKLT